MTITTIIQNGVVAAVKALYDHDIEANSVTMNSTRSEFEGDYTVVAFPYLMDAFESIMVYIL